MKRLILISACFAAASGAFAQEYETNSFVRQPEECVKTAVNLTGNQLTLATSGAKSTTWKKSYVYYEKKRMKKRDKHYQLDGVAAKHPSAPLLLNSSTDITPIPERYNVSVAVPQGNVAACEDSSADVAAVLSVERVASYTGNYMPENRDFKYTKVKKRHYKMAARKIRKIERKQDKIAKRAHVKVETRSTRKV